MRKILAAIFVILIIYIGSYLLFRQSHIEVWEKDQKGYVIFPENLALLYYLYRPLSYIDTQLTGIGNHIGPHR